MEIKEVKNTIYLIGVALALNGCNPEKRSLPPPTPAVVSPVATFPEVSEYYPALRNFTLRGEGVIDTDITSTKWFNYSPRDFNASAAQKTLKYYEELARKNMTLTINYFGTNLEFSLVPRAKTKRALFIVPENAPTPEWAGQFKTATKLYFQDPYEDIPELTVIRTSNQGKAEVNSRFRSASALNSLGFFVEACQSTLQAEYEIPQLNQHGQEITCNSFGMANSLKEQQASYNDYTTWAKNATLTSPTGVKLNLYILSESQYSQMPRLTKVLS